MDQSTIVDLAETIDTELARRLDFLMEIDKLKSVLRRSLLVDGSRRENTAEHSWHLAMAALVLAPHADDDVDITRAIEILLVHDLVEIDAGDTYIYDTTAAADKVEREERAAERIFGLLPADQAEYIDSLWRDYEARATPTARFAHAIDRLQPFLLNAASGGRSWQEHGIAHSQPAALNARIEQVSPPLAQVITTVLDTCADQGVLIDDRAQAGAERP